jgi:uncharacterized LabA/DUF88 family protein
MTRYAFIDGGYLREKFGVFTKTYFGIEETQPKSLDFDAIKTYFGGEKVFYYDAIDDSELRNESGEQRRKRLESQESYFDGIRSHYGYHVRLGSVTGTYKRLRQKQVDVLLAVDMLHHGFHRNMTHAVLLSGDLDFKPIVDSLVQHGIWVSVSYDQSGVSKELRWSADENDRIKPTDYWNWCRPEFREAHLNSFPKFASQRGISPVIAKTITLPMAVVEIHTIPGTRDHAAVSSSPIFPSGDTAIHHHDLDALEKFVTDMYGGSE